MKLTVRTDLKEQHCTTHNDGSYGNASNIKTVLLVLFVLCTNLFSIAQSVSPSTINISGQSITTGNYQFDWSVGEAASIITMTSTNIVVTTGVLQSFAAYQPEVNTNINWLTGEIKIYPNPTKDILDINILHQLKGKNKMELLDAQGRKLMEKHFDYYGTGRIEKWDLSTLPAGQYIVHIQLSDMITGLPIKKGSFKILKIQ